MAEENYKLPDGDVKKIVSQAYGDHAVFCYHTKRRERQRQPCLLIMRQIDASNTAIKLSTNNRSARLARATAPAACRASDSWAGDGLAPLLLTRCRC